MEKQWAFHPLGPQKKGHPLTQHSPSYCYWKTQIYFGVVLGLFLAVPLSLSLNRDSSNVYLSSFMSVRGTYVPSKDVHLTRNMSSL